MRRNENLHPKRGEPAQGCGNNRDQPRIEIGFRLVPEQDAVLQQRAIEDQMDQAGYLAMPFGEQMCFKIAIGRCQIEAVAGETKSDATFRCRCVR